LLKNAVHARPAAYSTAPSINTRLAPYLSAMNPMKGCAAPHTKFRSAMANEKISLPQFMSAEIGCKNRPENAFRVPMAMPKMMATANSARNMRCWGRRGVIGKPARRPRGAGME